MKRNLFFCVLMVLSMAAALPAAGEPVPPGPVCPDPCTEWFCNSRGICYCRPYPNPERCPAAVPDAAAILHEAAHPSPAVVASFDEAPDANLCVIECKQDCANNAAALYLWCIDVQPAGINCTQFAADDLDTCNAVCDGMNGCWHPN